MLGAKRKSKKKEPAIAGLFRRGALVCFRLLLGCRSSRGAGSLRGTRSTGGAGSLRGTRSSRGGRRARGGGTFSRSSSDCSFLGGYRIKSDFCKNGLAERALFRIQALRFANLLVAVRAKHIGANFCWSKAHDAFLSSLELPNYGIVAASLI